MISNISRQLNICVQDFNLPAYEQIPDIGLYLEQTVRYVNSFYTAFPDMQLTISMISNYVKKKLIASPVKKQYHREQIAQLLFIAAAKQSVSIDNLNLMMQLQQATYPTDVAYEYFRRELKNMLSYVFELKDLPQDMTTTPQTEQKTMLRNAVIAIAHKIYLDQYLIALYEENQNNTIK